MKPSERIQMRRHAAKTLRDLELEEEANDQRVASDKEMIKSAGRFLGALLIFSSLLFMFGLYLSMCL